MSADDKKAYREKLLDPRWQKLRLEVFERDRWKCQICRSKDKTLHVHHGHYESGRQPWEYEAESLITLCEDCHRAEPLAMNVNSDWLICLLKMRGFTSLDISALAALFDRPRQETVKFIRPELERLFPTSNEEKDGAAVPKSEKLGEVSALQKT